MPQRVDDSDSYDSISEQLNLNKDKNSQKKVSSTDDDLDLDNNRDDIKKSSWGLSKESIMGQNPCALRALHGQFSSSKAYNCPNLLLNTMRKGLPKMQA
eukprot:scaffold29433_cov62-Attheya_sp.AAC.1